MYPSPSDDNGDNGTMSVDMSLVTFNMHGFNQGVQTIRDLVNERHPAIIALQEHWLTPCNMYKLNDNFPTYICAGMSAMANAVGSGVLKGRPFGGVALLIDKCFYKCTKIVVASERYVVVCVGDMLIINVYLPCSGTDNRQFICDEILHEIECMSPYILDTRYYYVETLTLTWTLTLT